MHNHSSHTEPRSRHKKQIYEATLCKPWWQCAWVVQCWTRCCVYFHSYVCVWRTSILRVVTTTGTSRILELIPEWLKAPTLHIDWTVYLHCYNQILLQQHWKLHSLFFLLNGEKASFYQLSSATVIFLQFFDVVLNVTLFTSAETPWRVEMKTVSFRHATRWITWWALFSYHSCSAPPLNSPTQFGDISLLHCFWCFQYKCKVSQQNLNRITV